MGGGISCWNRNASSATSQPAVFDGGHVPSGYARTAVGAVGWSPWVAAWRPMGGRQTTTSGGGR